MSLKTLTSLGFTAKEASLYTLFLQHGRLSAAEAAKLSGISRPTVYSVAKELVRKGIITEDVAGPRRIFVARPPQDLTILANREQRRLEEKQTLITRAIEELKSIAVSERYEVPKLVFIQEEQIEDYLYKQTPIWNKSIEETDGIYWGFQDHTFPEQFEEWIHWYWTQAPKTISLQLLSNDSQIEKQLKNKKYERRNIRFWEQANDFTASSWVMGDYVAMISTRTHPFSLIEIHDATFAENFRTLFRGIAAYPHKEGLTNTKKSA